MNFAKTICASVIFLSYGISYCDNASTALNNNPIKCSTTEKIVSLIKVNLPIIISGVTLPFIGLAVLYPAVMDDVFRANIRNNAPTIIAMSIPPSILLQMLAFGTSQTPCS